MDEVTGAAIEPTPSNYCKVEGCTEPFAYDHRCEKHAEGDDGESWMVHETGPVTGSLLQVVAMLERRGVITTDPAAAGRCCGSERDEDGWCIYDEGHPIYVSLR